MQNNSWSNLEILQQDAEIMQIDNLQNSLGELPQEIQLIRKLITGFEVCHFKYRQHLEKIKSSITSLHPAVTPDTIGSHHIKHGKDAWHHDSTGKSLLGQQYLWALEKWLDDGLHTPARADEQLENKVRDWLGRQTPEKIRLVRYLVARLTWDWKTFDEMQTGGKYKDIEFQAARMDICHYAFPHNLDLLLQAMGTMQTAKKFEGCGMCNDSIKAYCAEQFSRLNEMLACMCKAESPDKNEQIKMWLIACLAKTLKEQTQVQMPITIFS